MITINHVCGSCESQFTITYDEIVCEDAPHYCPFCGNYLLEDDFEYEDD